MKPSLKERLEQLGRAPVPCGSAVALILSLSHPPGAGLPETISAIRALVRAGMAVLKAKRTIEELFNNPEAIIDLPVVEDTKALIEELARSGINARLLVPDPVEASVPVPQ